MASNFHQPVDAAKVPRFAGHSTFMRLPAVATADGLDIALVGIPWDGGTTNRAGARHGPREVRNLSSLMRRTHHASGIAPFNVVNVADVGDLAVNPINLMDGLALIEQDMKAIVAAGALPLSVGGDHLTTLPVLRVVAHKGPIGMIYMEEFVKRGAASVMKEARSIVGKSATYVTFDVDSIDPSMAPGTGTPEIGGFTTREAQELVCFLAGVNIVRADVVEVSPPGVSLS